jgi:hypothetical protein
MALVYVRSVQNKVIDNIELESIKSSIDENPGDITARQKARTKDLEVRNEYFKRLEIYKRGGYLLFALLLLFVIWVARKNIFEGDKPDISKSVSHFGDKKKSGGAKKLIIISVAIFALFFCGVEHYRFGR